MWNADAVLKCWYEGEVGGEALFWGLAEAAEPELARKWLSLAEVESRVARMLAGVIASRSQPIPECADDLVRERARARRDAVSGKSWLELMQWLKLIAASALAEMRADAARLPAELSAAGRLVVAHEQALVDFADLEIAGRGAESLRPVTEFLSLLAARPGRQDLVGDRVIQ